MRLRFLYISWIFFIALSIVPLWWQNYIENMYYDFILNALFPVIGLSAAIIAFKKAGSKEKKDFALVIGIAVFFTCLYQVFQEIHREDVLTDTMYGEWGILWLMVYVCFLILAIRQIIKDRNHLEKAPFVITLILLGAIIVATFPIIEFTFVTLSQNIGAFEFVLAIIFLIVDSLALVSLSIVLYLYFRLKYGYYWTILISAFATMLFRDIAFAYYTMTNTTAIHAISDGFIFAFYSSLIVGLLSLVDPSLTLESLKAIDAEREYFKTRYEELEYLSKDLMTVSELWFHDFKNDINVIKNALEIFLETDDEKFLTMLSDRINLVEDRQERYQAPANLLDSLKIQPIAVSTLRDIQKGYKRVRINCPSEPIFVKANKLLFPVVLNIIHNAFQHSKKEDLQVILDITEEGESVFLRIKDDGKGIADEIKPMIFQKNYIRENKTDSGMGLYLTKITIDKYGGKISVEDNIPSGAIFTIELQKIEV